MTWQSTVDASLLSELNAAQLALLGLSTAELQNTQMTMGIPPNVQGIQSASVIGATPSGSPHTAYTFSADGRVWGVCLSGSVAVGASYSSASNRVYFLAQIDGSTQLAVIEESITEADQITSDVIYVPFNGLAVASGQPLELIVNGGAAIVDVDITASVVFFYSVP